MLATKLKRFSNYLFHARNVKRLLTTSSTRCSSAYEPDGKISVSIINHEKNGPLMIDSYSQLGFRLNNGLFVIGPMVIFPQTVISWNVQDDRDINEDSLSFFFNLDPKLDILVIGISDIHLYRNQLDKKILDILQKMKLHVEVLPSDRACSTFNFLNSEQRYVAAALIPPFHIRPTDDEMFKLSYKNQQKKPFHLLL